MKELAQAALLPILAALALTSCSGPDLRCDDEGFIIIPEKAALEIQSEWSGRNLRLSTRRLQKVIGDPSTTWTTAASLEKAEGCP